MRSIATKLAFLFTALCITHASIAQQRPTPNDAIALVKEAVLYLNKNGKEKAFAEFSNPKGKFVNGELYIVSTGLDGVVLAHGANAKLIGKNIYDIKDMDGKLFVQEQIKVATTKGSGWVDFRWSNPVTKAIEPKTVYVERVGDLLLAGGIYKK